MDKIKELKEAKENVKWLLDHSKGLVEMKGIIYWATVVQLRREEIEQI